MRRFWRTMALAWALGIGLSLAACGAARGDATAPDAAPELTLWYSYPADSRDEAILLEAVDAFEDAHPEVAVDAVRLPFLQLVPQFITASQGGEAPDVVRLADTHLGRIAPITVDGLPLLEDLRPHLTPSDLRAFDPRAVEAMRVGAPLFAIPSSQGSVSLLYNRALFAAADVNPPNADWTTDDLVDAARALTTGDVSGLSYPLRWTYWWIPFQSGFGGRLFDDEGAPALDSPGSAAALEWVLALEQKERLVTGGGAIETMKTRFTLGRAAMVLDGPWNLEDYRDAGIDVGQAPLPTVPATGARMAPLMSYFGWSVSKQSRHKVAAADLARWLTSEDLQRRIALETSVLPTRRVLKRDPQLRDDPILAGFIDQLDHSVTAPTRRGVQGLYVVVDTGIELTSTGAMTAEDALRTANEELARMME